MKFNVATILAISGALVAVATTIKGLLLQTRGLIARIQKVWSAALPNQKNAWFLSYLLVCEDTGRDLR
jgi:hypothetical protein